MVHDSAWLTSHATINFSTPLTYTLNLASHLNDALNYEDQIISHEIEKEEASDRDLFEQDGPEQDGGAIANDIDPSFPNPTTTHSPPITSFSEQVEEAQDLTQRKRKRGKSHKPRATRRKHSSGDIIANETITPNPTNPLPTTLSADQAAIKLAHQQRKRMNAHRSRAIQRKKQKEDPNRPVLPELRSKLVHNASPLPTSLNVSNLPVTRCGYLAKNQRCQDTSVLPKLNLEALLNAGYALVEWDGRTPRPLCDPNGKVFGVLVGRPSGDSWDVDSSVLHSTLMSQGAHANFTKHQLNHRRGKFPAYDIGVSHGKGTKGPVNLLVNPPELQEILELKELHRVSSFASRAFQTWAPNLYFYYIKQLDKLFSNSRFKHLKRIFPSAPPFPCMSGNSGPQVHTTRHRDSMNLPFGWCGIQALGNFDYTIGGHLVLDDIQAVIQFPPNSIILIPSATLLHSNLPILPSEERSSLTFFCPGGLFRFVDAGLRTEKDLEKEDLKSYKEFLLKKETRWEMGIGLLSNLDELATYKATSL